MFMKRWSHPPGSNRRPADYESAALPTELGGPCRSILTTRCEFQQIETPLIDTQERKRILHGIQKASQILPADIFDWPSRRSSKAIGCSVMRLPRRTSRYFNSTRNE